MTDVISGTPTEFEFECSSDTTLSNLIYHTGHSYSELELDRYYFIGPEFGMFSNELPYLQVNNRVLWNVQYEEAKVVDFVQTHGLKQNDKIYFSVGMIQAGGPGIKLIMDLWKECYPILDQFATTVAILGFTVKFSTWLKIICGFSKRKTPPTAFFDFITRKDTWNPHELASMLRLNSSEARHLLKGLGYEWDKNTMLYCKTAITEELIKGIQEINCFQVGNLSG